MKRFFSFLMVSIIIILNLFVSANLIFASDTADSSSSSWDFPENYNDMTLEEKEEYWGELAPNGRNNWVNYFEYNTQAQYDFRNYLVHEAVSGKVANLPAFILDDVTNVPNYLAQNVTYNPSTQELENSEGLQIQINNLIGSYNQQATYIQGYMPGAGMLDPTPFTHASVYKFVKNTIKNNPDFYFFIERDVYTGGYLLLATNIAPLGGVSAKANWRNSRISATIYNDDWNQDFTKDTAGEWAICCINAQNNGDSHITFTYCEGNTSGGTWAFSEEQTATTAGVDMSDYVNPEITNENVSTVNPSFGMGGRFTGYQLFRNTADIASLYSTGQLGFGGSGICWHGAENYWALDIYNTIGDLKRGNVGVKQASYLPNYTGSAPSAVSSSYGNILNNYVGSGGTGTGTGTGGGSSSDDGGSSDSSGSGWLDKIIDGLGSIGDALLNIVGVILEWVGRAIDFVTGTLDDVIELVTGNKFIEVLTAFFPFVPEEIWTGISLLLGMLLFASLINFLRK